jgi:DNA-binding CsgD family transcriptional regulator
MGKQSVAGDEQEIGKGARASSDDLAHYGALIDTIYAGALDPTMWQKTVDQMADWLDVSKVVLYTPLHKSQNGGFLLCHGIKQHELDVWATLHHLDVWTQVAVERQLIYEGSGCFLGTDLVPEDDLRETQWYREFLKPYDLSQMITSVVLDGLTGDVLPTVWSVFRGETERRFEEADLVRFRILLPHLSRALGVMYRLRGNDLRVSASHAALDSMASGVVLFAPSEQVVFANRAARRILENGDGLRLTDTPGQPLARLEADDSTASAELAEALRRTLRGDPTDIPHFSRSIRIPRTSGRVPYSLQISALPTGNELGEGDDAPRAIAFIADTLEPVQVDAKQLMDLYGLTPAEARLASALGAGDELAATAEQLGVALNTAKSQLQAIYAKTRLDSRTKLTKLLVALAEAKA